MNEEYEIIVFRTLSNKKRCPNMIVDFANKNHNETLVNRLSRLKVGESICIKQKNPVSKFTF